MTEADDDKPMGLATRNIFLDTQVYRSFGHNLNSKPMLAFKKYISEEIFSLHITDMTLDEIRLQTEVMAEELTKTSNKTRKQIIRWNSKLQQLRHSPLEVMPEIDADALASQTFDGFRYDLRVEWNVDIHSARDLLAGPVIDKYIGRNPPFDVNGSKEFPDAFALSALEGWCGARGQQVTQICQEHFILQSNALVLSHNSTIGIITCLTQKYRKIWHTNMV